MDVAALHDRIAELEHEIVAKDWRMVELEAKAAHLGQVLESELDMELTQETSLSRRLDEEKLQELCMTEQAEKIAVAKLAQVRAIQSKNAEMQATIDRARSEREEAQGRARGQVEELQRLHTEHATLKELLKAETKVAEQAKQDHDTRERAKGELSATSGQLKENLHTLLRAKSSAIEENTARDFELEKMATENGKLMERLGIEASAGVENREYATRQTDRLRVMRKEVESLTSQVNFEEERLEQMSPVREEKERLLKEHREEAMRLLGLLNTRRMERTELAVRWEHVDKQLGSMQKDRDELVAQMGQEYNQRRSVIEATGNLEESIRRLDELHAEYRRKHTLIGSPSLSGSPSPRSPLQSMVTVPLVSHPQVSPVQVSPTLSSGLSKPPPPPPRLASMRQIVDEIDAKEATLKSQVAILDERIESSPGWGSSSSPPRPPTLALSRGVVTTYVKSS